MSKHSVKRPKRATLQHQNTDSGYSDLLSSQDMPFEDDFNMNLYDQFNTTNHTELLSKHNYNIINLEDAIGEFT